MERNTSHHLTHRKCQASMGQAISSPTQELPSFQGRIAKVMHYGALRALGAEEIEEREWASPAFGIPKKNGTILLVINFCRIIGSKIT